MSDFKIRAKALFENKEKRNIDSVEYMDMPMEREKYNLSRVIGNVNLAEGRFRTKSEADVIIDRFLAMPLP